MKDRERDIQHYIGRLCGDLAHTLTPRWDVIKHANPTISKQTFVQLVVDEAQDVAPELAWRPYTMHELLAL